MVLTRFYGCIHIACITIMATVLSCVVVQWKHRHHHQLMPLSWYCCCHQSTIDVILVTSALQRFSILPHPQRHCAHMHVYGMSRIHDFHITLSEPILNGGWRHICGVECNTTCPLSMHVQSVIYRRRFLAAKWDKRPCNVIGVFWTRNVLHINLAPLLEITATRHSRQWRWWQIFLQRAEQMKSWDDDDLYWWETPKESQCSRCGPTQAVVVVKRLCNEYNDGCLGRFF